MNASRRAELRTRCAVSAVVGMVLGMLVPALAHADPSALVRVTVRDPFSPYHETVYEWKSTGRTPVVGMSRQFRASFGFDSALALVPEEEYGELLEALSACMDGLGPSPERPSAVDGRAREVVLDADVGGVRRIFAWRDGDDLGERRCADRVREVVLARIDLPAFRNPYWLEGQYGMVNTDPGLPARLWIDGRDTGLTTPIHQLRVAPGRRRFGWVSADGLTTGEVELAVGAGQTVTIRYRLVSESEADAEEVAPDGDSSPD